MTSQAQAIEPLPGVKGLAFIGFPLHPAGKPSAERAEHLREVKSLQCNLSPSLPVSLKVTLGAGR
jgi:predicted alpha/beta-hydrolase family hydrolase